MGKLESDPKKSPKGVSGWLNVNLYWEPQAGMEVHPLTQDKDLHQYIRAFGELQKVGMSAQRKTSNLAFHEVVQDFWSRPQTPHLRGNLTVEIVSAKGLADTNARVEVEV